MIASSWRYNPDVYAPRRYQRPCQYDAFLPDPLTNLPALEMEIAGRIAAAEDAIRDLNREAQPALAPLGRLLLRTEAIASSRVEGLQVDARALARAEARSDDGQTIGRQPAEILANIDAMQLAVEDAGGADELTFEHIQRIQSVLVADATNAGRIAGVIRTSQNWVGGNDYNPCGADFVPPPPEHVDGLLDDLVAYLNDDSPPPLAQAAIAHAQFETIHPFADGNGRAGRVLLQVILRRRGIAPDYVPPISVVLAADKDAYIAGLTAFRRRREHEWLGMFSDAAMRAASLAITYLRRVESLQDQWRDRASRVVRRSDAAAWRVIDQLPGHPIISVPTASALTSRTRPAVSQAIDQLVSAEVLTPLSTGRRNRHWEAIGLLDILGDLESAVSG